MCVCSWWFLKFPSSFVVSSFFLPCLVERRRESLIFFFSFSLLFDSLVYFLPFSFGGGYVFRGKFVLYGRREEGG